MSLFATGIRNGYDLSLTKTGTLWTIDNGGNAGWGGAPIPIDLGCSEVSQDQGLNRPNILHRIDLTHYHGGHPNPVRDRGPGVECSALASRPALAQFSASTNGLVEYTSSAFEGAMAGDLLAVSWDGTLQRIDIDENNDIRSVTVLVQNVGSAPLSLEVPDHRRDFAGTIWVGNFASRNVSILEPVNSTRQLPTVDPVPR